MPQEISMRMHVSIWLVVLTGCNGTAAYNPGTGASDNGETSVNAPTDPSCITLPDDLDFSDEQLLATFSLPRFGVCALRNGVALPGFATIEDIAPIDALVERLRNMSQDDERVLNALAVVLYEKFQFYYRQQMARKNAVGNSVADAAAGFRAGGYTRGKVEAATEFFEVRQQQLANESRFAVIDFAACSSGRFQTDIYFTAREWLEDEAQFEDSFKEMQEEMSSNRQALEKASEENRRAFLTIMEGMGHMVQCKKRLEIAMATSVIEQAVTKEAELVEQGYWPAVDARLRWKTWQANLTNDEISQYLDAATEGDALCKVNAASIAFNSSLRRKATAPILVETLLRDAANLGFEEAWAKLGEIHLQTGHSKEAIAAFKQGVSVEDATSQVALGRQYVKGDNVAQNNERALSLFEAAHQQGYADGSYFLAVFHMNNTDNSVPDWRKIESLLRTATMKDHAAACYRYAFYYWYGLTEHGIGARSGKTVVHANPDYATMMFEDSMRICRSNNDGHLYDIVQADFAEFRESPEANATVRSATSRVSARARIEDAYMRRSLRQQGRK